MKKMTLFLLALAACLGLTGCGEEEPILYKSPPALTVTSGGQSVEALTGTFSWEFLSEDGGFQGIEADALHPLESREYMTRLETGEGLAELTFAEPPDSFQVRCWSEDPAQWNIRCLTGVVDPMYAAIPEELPVTGGKLEVKPGSYIYEVYARWDMGAGETWGGSAFYSFWIDRK